MSIYLLASRPDNLGNPVSASWRGASATRQVKLPRLPALRIARRVSAQRWAHICGLSRFRWLGSSLHELLGRQSCVKGAASE